MATTFNTIPTKRLAATISGSSADIKLNNILGWDGADLTPAYLGDVLYAVLRDQDNSVIEIMQLDPTTIANNSTTGITITRRGLKFNGDLTTEVPANKLVWVKNQTIVEIGTDVPQIFQNFVNFTDAQNIGGVKTFTSLPATTAGNPVSANDLARKAYVDSVVAGIATSVSNVVPGTAGETLVAGNLVYLKLADSRWWKADADTASTVENVLLGIAQGAGTAGNTITNGVMTRGVDTNQSGLSAGSVYYASNTAGGISSSAGTVEVTVGVAKSTTELYFDPRFNQQITEDQQDALAGTSGTPSASNKYVTDADTTGTGSLLRSSAVSTKYGGTGADGALSITSGSTNIDLGSAQYVVKNYTSISITGTGALTFTNPHASGTIIILKSQGNVTLTSSATPCIDTRSMGAAAITDGTGMFVRGTSSTTSAGGLQWSPIHNIASMVAQKAIYVACGSGGGNSRTTGNAVGGRGGGGLYIECGGALNFTGTINTSGANGGTGTGEYGGAGGGSAGLCVILYNTLTTNSGTITATGGNGSAGGGVSAGTGDGGAGAGGLSGAGGTGADSGGGGNAGGAGAGGGGGSTQGGNQPGGSGGASTGGFVFANTEIA